MFNGHFDESLQKLQDHGIGWHAGIKFMGAFIDTDVLTLLFPSLGGLQKADHICKNLAQHHSVQFISKKIQCMCIGKDGECLQDNIDWEGEKLKWVNCTRQLTWNLTDDDDIQLKFGHFYVYVDNLCAKFKYILNNPYVTCKFLCALLFFLWFPAAGLF